MPLSDRFTRSTSEACSSIPRFLWITPRPPCCAIAMASRLSVTVSIAALRIGTFNRIRRVSREPMSTWLGRIFDCRGTSTMSSKVRASESPAATLPAAFSDSAIAVLDRAELIVSPEPDGPNETQRTRLCPVALLELLPAPTPTRIVAADLGFVAPNRLHGRVVAAGARRSGRPAAHRRGRGGRGAHRRRRRCGRATAHRQLGRPARRGLPDRCRRILAANDRTQPPQVPNDVVLDAFLHGLEQREALFLVLDERIALAVAAQTDAFLQVVETVEMVLPLRVDNLEHDVALDAAEQRGIEPRDLFFLLVGGGRQVAQRLG